MHTLTKISKIENYLKTIYRHLQLKSKKYEKIALRLNLDFGASLTQKGTKNRYKLSSLPDRFHS